MCFFQFFDLFLFSFIAFFFFFNDTATTEIYTLSLHDALPISASCRASCSRRTCRTGSSTWRRSEEHTSELQSQFHLVCRLLLEKKKQTHMRAERVNQEVIRKNIEDAGAHS